MPLKDAWERSLIHLKSVNINKALKIYYGQAHLLLCIVLLSNLSFAFFAIESNDVFSRTHEWRQTAISYVSVWNNVNRTNRVKNVAKKRQSKVSHLICKYFDNK